MSATDISGPNEPGGNRRRDVREWVLLGAALLILGALLAIFLRREYEETNQRERLELSRLGQVVNATLENRFVAIANTLGRLREDWDAAPRGGKTTHDLQVISEALLGVRTIVLFDVNGIARASSREELVGKDFSGREYFQKAKAANDPTVLYLSPPFTTALGVYAMQVTQSVRGPDGQFAGVVGVTLDPKYFESLLDAVHYAEDAWISIAHMNGDHFMIVPDNPALMGKNLDRPGSFFTRHKESGKALDIFSGVTASTGEERLIAIQTIRPAGLNMDGGLVVAISRDLPSVFSQWTREARLGGIAFFLLTLVAAAWLRTRQRRRAAIEFLKTNLRKERRAAEEKMRLSHERLTEREAHYRALFDDSSVVMLLIDPADGRIRDANAAASAFYGYSAGQLRAMSIQQINTLTREQIQAEMARAKAEGRTVFEFRHRLADGRVRDVAVSSGPMQVDGKTLLLSVIADVTDRRIAERQMRQALVVYNASNQGILTADASGRIASVNPAFTRITGFRPDEVIGKNPSMFKSGRHDSAFYEAMWRELDSTGIWEGEIWNRRRDGSIYPEWLTISRVLDDRGEVAEYVALFNDITERKRLEEDVWKRANFDALTGLANRNLFADRLERALAQARRNGRKVGLAFLDLDGFKWINDTLGHDAGDKLLVETADRLKKSVREEDTVARLGGDEFTAIIHDLDDPRAMRPIAEKLVSVLREPFLLGDVVHQISGSVGVTIFPNDGEDVQTLLKNADMAMYRAKQRGKNRCQFFASQIQADVHERVALESDLRAAFGRSDFALHYQPIVDADSGEIVAAEALLRWKHPERGLIQPLDFVPVAEDCGLIVPIGEWAVREAARQWRDWRAKGYPPIKISVNASDVQFREENFNDVIEKALEDFGVDPGCLSLEITESVLMDGSAEAEARIRSIKALGVGFSLDDFGTGFSSLSYLKKFPVDTVKIDRSFVNDCPADHSDASLVEAIVNMAHSLGLSVTAEGVETEDQLEFLRDLGCDTVQGFLVDRPLPPDSFEILLQRRQLLLPTDGATFDESRLLAALRTDSLDLDDWLPRLLGERDPGLTDFEENKDLKILGLDLRHAIEGHLAWRKRLDRYIAGAPDADSMSVGEAAAHDLCALGQWIAKIEPRLAGPCLERLDEAHRTFHRMAGLIVDDFRFGHRGLARRALSGTAFRKASRDVVAALVACYRDSRQKDEERRLESASA